MKSITFQHTNDTESLDLLRRLGIFKVIQFVRSTPSWRSTTITATAAAVEIQEIKTKVANIEMELRELKVSEAVAVTFIKISHSSTLLIWKQMIIIIW